MGVQELAVMVNFASEIGIFLAGGLEHNLHFVSSGAVPLAYQANVTFDPLVSLCVAR